MLWVEFCISYMPYGTNRNARALRACRLGGAAQLGADGDTWTEQAPLLQPTPALLPPTPLLRLKLPLLLLRLWP